MDKPLIIHVTEADLLKASINSPTSDPICLAAQRAGLRQPRCAKGRILRWEEVASRDAVSGRPTSLLLKRVILPLEAVSFLQHLTYEDRFQIKGLPLTFNCGHPVAYGTVQL